MAKLTELSSSVLASPTNAFFAIGDPQNFSTETVATPLSFEVLKQELHFYLLFCDRLTLVAEDLLLNTQLCRLLLSGEYRVLMEEGLFVPLLRSKYDELEDVTQYLTKPDLYQPEGEHTWSVVLKELKQTNIYVGRFDEDQAYSNFTDIARFYMYDAAFMEGFGARELVVTLPRRLDELRKSANREELRRSLFFFYAKELQRNKQRRLARVVRHISSVLYTAQFCGQFGQLPAFPGWYSKYLTKTTGIIPSDDGNVAMATELKSLSLNYLSPRIKPEAGKLTLREVLQIRESQEFKSFLEETRRFNSGGDTGSLKAEFLNSLLRYLQFLDQRVGEIRAGLYPRKRNLQRQISFLELTTPTGIILSVSSLILSQITGLSISALWSPIWWHASLSFFFYKRDIKSEVSEIEKKASALWSSTCSPSGTFAAALTSAVPKINRKSLGAPGR